MVFVSNNHPSARFSRTETLRAVECVLEVEDVRKYELSVVFVGSRFIRNINRKHLGHDYVTDVIAFPLGEKDAPLLEGELYVNLDRAQSQARAYGVSIAEETRRLLIHGTLHLLGYTDLTQEKKKAMTRREDEILGRLSATRR